MDSYFFHHCIASYGNFWGWRGRFHILPILKRIGLWIGFLFFTILGCASRDWYREFPPESPTKSPIFQGVYEKKTPSRAPIRSSHVFHVSSEKIFIYANGQFRREYKSKWMEGSSSRATFVQGEGIFFQRGNWVLFVTKMRRIQEMKNERKESERILDSEMQLNYYLWKQGTVLIPMIYEKGYEEKNFGVKDGMKIPFDEASPEFQRYLQFYTFEEYQPHAYFFTRENG